MRGGPRPGSGRPKGKQTIEKEVAREFARQTIIASLGPMLRSQIAHATGIGHCYTRDKNGKFSRVEKLSEIDRLLTQGTENEDYFIFAKDPSAVAFKELLDRALDRPKEQAQEVHVTGEIELFTRLAAARQRVIDITKTPDVPQIADGGLEEK